MAFQTAITIGSVIRDIEANRYLLPAIQREFVWTHEQIENLFDSIMRGYPISSFLFWRVEGDTRKAYKFYQFIRNYKQRYKTRNSEFDTTGHDEFIAILDGQQRLTSLLIGLRGSFAYRRPRLREEDSERVYPTRELYLNIIEPLEDNEDGNVYEFKFLTGGEYDDNKEKWFKVSEIYGLRANYEFIKCLDTRGYNDNEFSCQSLSILQEAVHTKGLINHYLEKDQDIDKALNIFIRVNSGGKPLDFPDLIMSIAVANWKTKDARKVIHELTDNIQGKGFDIKKDFILKSFLYLHSKDIKFKVTNFSKSNAQAFEFEWEKIRDTILSVFDLIKTFGFVDSTLISKNSLIPIVYYLYHRGIEKDFSVAIKYEEDRKVIEKWLHVVLIKQLLGGSSDTVLSQIRGAFTDDVTTSPISREINFFPAADVNKAIRKNVGVTDEFIEEILLISKDDRYAFSILALLYPNLDYKNNNFHKDHLHPQGSFDDLSESAKQNHGWGVYDSLINLQILDANENMSKQDKSLQEWVDSETTSKNRETFLESHLIPNVSLGLKDFDCFVATRKKLLANKLKTILT